ncbi:hypothetical protein HY374_01875 [Candidatus Berkelbacteria bacterium]|nr:hypothetical protein [Candidatus Berkelbacteria bacterium]
MADMQNIFHAFWTWYERHERLGVTVATFLFLWQLVHLLWLTTDVVIVRLFGTEPILTSSFAQLLIAIVDYTEIPALIATSLVYLNDIRKGTAVWRSVGYLILLNSQWVHLFWITDEFVVHSLVQGHTSSFSPALAWVAIGIDYLELPVMINVTSRWLRSLARH